MKAAPFEYERPSDLRRANDLLEQSKGAGKVLAGGQSLIPMMNLRLARPELLVDIGGLSELKRVEARDGHLFIGATVTHSTIEDGELPEVTKGMLPFVAAGIGYRGVRNLGTIGGSLAHLDPAADWPCALVALGAEVDIAGPARQKNVPLEEFFIGAFTTVLEAEEILVGVRVPKLSAAARWAYYKVCRKTGEFADSIGAVVLDPARAFHRVVLGGTDGAPMLLTAVASELASGDGEVYANRFGPEEAVAALEDAGATFDPIDLQIHAAVLSRAVRQAFAR